MERSCEVRLWRAPLTPVVAAGNQALATVLSLQRNRRVEATLRGVPRVWCELRLVSSAEPTSATSGNWGLSGSGTTDRGKGWALSGGRR